MKQFNFDRISQRMMAVLIVIGLLVTTILIGASGLAETSKQGDANHSWSISGENATITELPNLNRGGQLRNPVRHTNAVVLRYVGDKRRFEIESSFDLSAVEVGSATLHKTDGTTMLITIRPEGSPGNADMRIQRPKMVGKRFVAGIITDLDGTLFSAPESQVASLDVGLVLSTTPPIA